MNAQTQDEVILNQDGEVTDLTAPADFGNNMSFLNPADMPDLDAAEVGFNIQPESVEFNTPGQSLRAVFNGFTFLNVKDKVNKGQYVQRETAVLQTKTGIKINMGANLIKQLKLIPVGTAVQITYKGKEPTASGNEVKSYDVNLLNVARVNFPATPKTVAPAVHPEPEQPMTYDDAWKIEINTVNGKKKIGELSKEQLDYVIEHGIVNRNVEAAKIVLQHDFNMSPLNDQGAFPF